MTTTLQPKIFAFPLHVQERKFYKHIYSYNFTSFLWVRNLDSRPKGRPQIEDV